MEKSQTKNGNENGAKPLWERPIQKEDYTAEELELIKAGRAVLKIIHERVERGEYDDYLKERKNAKR